MEPLFIFITSAQNPYLGILLGLLAGVAVSVIVGPFFVRLRSDYFALVNLALAVIVYYLMEKVLAGITHGDNGLWFLTNMSSTPVLDLTRPNQFFIFAFLVAMAVWAFYKYLDDSVYGACCLATKINEDKLKFLGYSNFNIRWLAFVIANTTTALAGSLYAVYFGFVSPEITSPARCADPVVVTILGGVGTLYGPIVGAIAYTGMKDLISGYIANWELFIGLLLVFIMLAGETGKMQHHHEPKRGCILNAEIPCKTPGSLFTAHAGALKLKVQELLAKQEAIERALGDIRKAANTGSRRGEETDPRSTTRTAGAG